MVTVIGGGIAGAALAGALALRGERVRLFEQQARNSGGGAFLFIDDRGHRALSELGVPGDLVRAGSYPVAGGLVYANSLGRRGAINGRGHRFWMRDSLVQILREFIAEAGVDTVYGAPITDVTVTERGCVLRRGDDTTVLEDELIVGADGIDSVVRAGLEPERGTEYAGDVVLYGMTSRPVTLKTDPATLHFFAEIENGRPASTLGHIWRPGDPAALWFLRVPREALPGSDDLGRRPIEEWAETITTATPSNQALISAFLETTESVHVSNARNVPLTGAATPADPVVLIGDADHAITPAAGVGARDALEDAHAVYEAHLSGASPAAAMLERRRRILEDRELALRTRAR